MRHIHYNTIVGRLLCLLLGHVPHQVWMNEALGLEVENPDRPGTSQRTPKWERFGGGDIYLCPRCRVIFMPIEGNFTRR